MNWSWLPEYAPQLLNGFVVTLLIFSVSVVVGFVLAVPLALAQIGGGWLTRKLAHGFCITLRGIPLLLLLFLFYYGLGSVLALSPGLREVAPWLVRLDAFWYVLIAFTINFAAHEAEVLRGALRAVPRGELEAAESFGLGRFTILRRIWLPSAVLRVYPVLASDVIAQLKATPVAFVVPVVDLMAVAQNVLQDRLLIYVPLLFVAAIYLTATFLVLKFSALIGRLVPQNWLE